MDKDVHLNAASDFVDLLTEGPISVAEKEAGVDEELGNNSGVSGSSKEDDNNNAPWELPLS